MRKLQLYSKRLLLVPITWSDLEIVHELHSLPEVDEFNTLGIPEYLDETKGVIAPWIAEYQNAEIGNYVFAIRLQENQQFIGLFGLNLASQKFNSGEVWYKLHPYYWRKGYATEALNRVLDFGFEELKLHRIQAGCAVENIGSIKVLEKVGMTREGRKRKILPLKSGWSDNYHYAILETDERR
ncbi:MAG: GNAT family N-acetyltransferase [Bacteroidota bacterium]